MQNMHLFATYVLTYVKCSFKGIQFHDFLIPVTTYLAGAFKDFQSKGKLPARVRAMDMRHVFLILQFLAYSVCIFSMFCMFDILHILYVFAYFLPSIYFCISDVFLHTCTFGMFLHLCIFDMFCILAYFAWFCIFCTFDMFLHI